MEEDRVPSESSCRVPNGSPMGLPHGLQTAPRTLEVEIFVCERKRPLAGWSSDYLMPTDQHAYRVRGKRGGFNTIGEAENALLGPGFAWEATRWKADPGGQPADSEGWAYGVNFNSSFVGSAKGGLQMFTRWQRLTRTQRFGGLVALEQSVQQTYKLCPNFDLEYASIVGRNLQESIAAASLYADYNLHVLVKLKTQLLERLAPQRQDKHGSLESVLNEFITSQRPVASRLTEVLKGARDEAVTARMQEIVTCFLPAEREAYAILAIRRFRPDLACGVGSEEEHICPFAPVHCEHEGCSERCSAHSLAAHDATCPFKPMACEKCGEQLARGELHRHLSSACSMRDASCSYSSIGCNKAMTHRDVGNHLEECTQAHMLLLLQTVSQQQSVIQALTARVAELECNSVATGQKLATVEASVGKALNDNVSKALKDATASAEKKATAVGLEARKHADSAVAALRGEVGTVKTELSQVRGSITGLSTKLEPILKERKQ